MSNYDQAMQEARKLAATPQGRQLLQLIQKKDASQVQALIQQAAAGNMDQAKQILSSLLEDPETKSLLESLGGTYGK